MINKRLFLFSVLLMEILSLSAQRSEDIRLKALSFFCSKKNEILRVDNPLGEFIPTFVLDFRLNDADELYIDSNQFNPDSVVFESILASIKKEDFLINQSVTTALSIENNSSYSLLCDCIYCDQIMVLFDIPLENESPQLCRREYGLEISKVIYYKGFKYVILRITSFFMAKVDGIQFCIIEFSDDNNISRYGIGNKWFY